ncbi:hypothetical protein LJC26_03970 [Desulfovibrio sp. OttesenSCG-928-O18]|nr:hypothetical protein [Desulfovibrio sp. OttesenSCG-928-O18]
MKGKIACSEVYLEHMAAENHFEAARCALLMLEEFGDVIRHHEMMLTVNIRRENIAAALENCEEILSYGQLKGLDVTEFEAHRVSLQTRLQRTRKYLAAQFWDEVTTDLPGAPKRYATVPLIISGEAHCQENLESGAMFLVLPVRGDAGKRIACRLAPGETPFLAGIIFPQRVTVHGRFLSASETLVLLHPCHYLASFEIPWQ